MSGHDGGMFKRSRVTTAPDVAAVGPDVDPVVIPASGRDLVALVDAAGTGSADDVDRLGAVLAECALSGAQDARVLLKLVAREPTVLVRLDGIARRRANYGYLPTGYQAWVDRACARFDAAEGQRDPVVVAVASLAADGRVRERAVAAMGALRVPELVPFIVLRTADWAAPVRERASAALALRLYQRPADVVLAGPIAARLARRSRAGFALAQVGAALPRVADEMLIRLLADAPPAMRRLAAAQAPRLPLPVLVDLALAEPDPGTRDLVAESAAREALWRGRHEALHRLAAARSADVRAIGLAGLLRAGLADQAAGYLADPSPLVRATARFAARRAGIDVLDRYHRLARAEPVQPGALLGLAEATVNTNTGNGVARELIEPRLADGTPVVRAAAVTALRILGAADPAALGSLLADPAPVVVRAAAAVVESAGGVLDTSRSLTLLADPTRAAGARRALYRLCRRQHAAVRLAAGLLAAAAGDQKLAAWAARDLHAMALPAGPPARATRLRRELAGQQVVPDLPGRVEEARSLLAPDLYDALAAAVA